MANESDKALEKIRIAAQRQYRVDDKPTKEAVFSLLQRSWFKRIWVLQEVAAARQVNNFRRRHLIFFPGMRQAQLVAPSSTCFAFGYLPGGHVQTRYGCNGILQIGL
ncbi:hypothetical protein ABOM_008647 [Aspergillus bombycis]|uniref:Heterokaryon incompatibility domain-containing protein n=1 Tax=Aspergillus bombycis TaxID=109264 RepID=A0A1F7ZW46_9EURO|nr:hypothetical protein ABOM_008647 [Aspergillus bombycis]OGM43305.1 hypothetical protein ABOM_008647 [Aspergillus bombycis]